MKKIILFAILALFLHAHEKIIMQTSEGNITLRLFPKIAPKASENFIKLAQKGYYDGVIFHRVIKDFMIQSGDPTGTGMGGESIWGEDFEDEFIQGVIFNKPFLLAMANRGKNTNSSQFFITTKPTPWLNYRHTIFGEVIDGFNVIDKIEHTKTGFHDKPKKDISILKIVFK